MRITIRRRVAGALPFCGASVACPLACRCYPKIPATCNDPGALMPRQRLADGRCAAPSRTPRPRSLLEGAVFHGWKRGGVA